jgi:hypothetical protein
MSSLSFRFVHQNRAFISVLPHICHVSRPSHSPCLYRPDNN